MVDITNVGSKKGQDIGLILIILAVIILVFLVAYNYSKGIKGILEGIGLKDDKTDKAIQDRLTVNVNKAENAEYWKPSMWKNVKGAKILTQDSSKRIADQIYSSVGYFSDTPAQAVAAFKQLTAKTQVSYLVDRFNAIHKLDLKTFLNERFDTTEQKKALNDIYNYVQNLPKGGQ